MNTLSVLALCAVTLSPALAQDRNLVADAPLRGVFFLPGGNQVVGVCDKHRHTFDAATGAQIAELAIEPRTMFLDANLAVRVEREKGFQVWDLSADRHGSMINGTLDNAAVTTDHKQLAVSSARDRNVRLLDPSTGRELRLLPDGLGGAASLSFSPDGATLVSAGYDNDVRVWKTRSGELVHKIEDLTGAMFASAFTPNGAELVMGGLDETVYILDGRTFARKRVLKGHGETIAALAISPDGRTLVTGGFDVITVKNPVKLVFWDLSSGTITRTARSPHVVSDLAFSPDGKWLAMTAAGAKEISLFRLN